LSADTFRWFRDVAITATVVVLGFAVLATVTGHAYAGLPGAAPQPAPPAAAEDVVDPHGPEPACSACHRSHGAPEVSLLAAAHADSGMCVACHNADGADPRSSHGNAGYAFATQAPFTTTCIACHDPHGDPDAPGANRAMVRSVVNGVPVRYLAGSGADSLDDGLDDGVYDSLCVACHTTTLHNNMASLELMGEGHGPVGGNCTSCHPHGGNPALAGGFMPSTPPAPTATATATGAPPTDTPTPTESATPSPTDTPAPPEATATPPPATDTPTEVASATATETATPTP
jgi:predicted CXXCH cytochrome family protein